MSHMLLARAAEREREAFLRSQVTRNMITLKHEPLGLIQDTILAFCTVGQMSLIHRDSRDLLKITHCGQFGATRF